MNKELLPSSTSREVKNLIPEDLPLFYVKQVAETALLSIEEEKVLADRIQAGDADAKELLIKANLRLVIKLANRYTGYGIPLQDLVAEGNTGLIRAAEGFKNDKGAKFSTYASIWIRQRITKALEKQRKIIRLPAHASQQVRDLNKAEREFSMKSNHKPSVKELAEVMDIPEKTAIKIKLARETIKLRSFEDMVSVNPAHPTMCLTVEQVLEDNNPNPRQTFLKQAVHEELQQCLSLLSSRERDVISRRFGLTGNSPEKLTEIGKAYNLTRERIRQIQGKALKKLRFIMGSQDKSKIWEYFKVTALEGALHAQSLHKNR